MIRHAPFLLVACSTWPTLAQVEDAPARFRAADDWCYQLQQLDPEAMAGTAFDVLVTDPSRDGSDDSWWPAETVQRLQRGGRVVLAYLSVGEAEDYRGYWDADWRQHPPAWLGPENPDWKGNYVVRYWDPAWQRLLLGPGGPLERILERGYDGVYLDLIDAWEHFTRSGELSEEEAQRRMGALVLALTQVARARQAKFLVVLQNGAEVAARPEVLEAISGLALEDTFYDDEDEQPAQETRHVLGFARAVRKAGKPVLAVDYCRRREHVDDFYRRARAAGLIPYATVRELDRLVVDPGHEPD